MAQTPSIFPTPQDGTEKALASVLKSFLGVIFDWLFKAEQGITELLKKTLLGLIPKWSGKFDKPYRLAIVNALYIFITDLLLAPIFLLRVISSIVLAGGIMDIFVAFNIFISLLLAMLPASLYIAGHLYFIFQTAILIAINLIF